MAYYGKVAHDKDKNASEPVFISLAPQTEGKMPGIQDTLDQGHFTFLKH